MKGNLSYLIGYIPYAHHCNPLIITTRFWILTIHKNIISLKNFLENKEINSKNGVKYIQTTSYNCGQMVPNIYNKFLESSWFFHCNNEFLNVWWKVIHKSVATFIKCVNCGLFLTKLLFHFIECNCNHIVLTKHFLISIPIIFFSSSSSCRRIKSQDY